jgi:phage terminase small subunit
MGTTQKLSKKQQIFVDEYCTDFNATRAATMAGYSEKTARAIASENLTKLYIKEAIEERLSKQHKKSEITAELVLSGIKEIAFKQNAKETDRLRALELLGKYLKLFTDKIETKVETNEPIKIVFDDKMKDWSK